MYLNCKTYFSFKYGTFSTKALVEAGVEAGASAMALTNINNTWDVWDFVQYCRCRYKAVIVFEVRMVIQWNTLIAAITAAWHGFLFFPAFEQNVPFPSQATETPFLMTHGMAL